MNKSIFEFTEHTLKQQVKRSYSQPFLILIIQISLLCGHLKTKYLSILNNQH